jgi:hypothetical protein
VFTVVAAAAAVFDAFILPIIRIHKPPNCKIIERIFLI